MPAKKRNYKQEYATQKSRQELPDRMERQRARRAIDKTGVDKNGNGRADKREGKDVSHVVALSKGGSNAKGVKLQAPSKNRSFKRNAKGALVSETSKRERKKK